MANPALFFDIDGCLHPYGLARRNEQGKVRRAPDDGLFVWCQPLHVLLTQYPQLDLVCHSSWRELYTLEELREQLPASLARRTVGCTRSYIDRHESIITYAKEQGISHYRILDDDPWAFPNKLPELILVQSDTGLSTPKALADLHAAVTTLVQDSMQNATLVQTAGFFPIGGV